MSFLEAQVIFPSNFASILSGTKHKPSVFSKLKHYILHSKAADLSANFLDFWVLRSKFVKLLMTILNWQDNSFSNFVLLFIIRTPVSFKLIYFLLWIKGSNKSPNFETFVCSGRNLLNSSCHFPNQKSLFFQILNHSLVLINITPLYFFSSDTIYFGQKQSIKK